MINGIVVRNARKNVRVDRIQIKLRRNAINAGRTAECAVMERIVRNAQWGII